MLVQPVRSICVLYNVASALRINRTEFSDVVPWYSGSEYLTVRTSSYGMNDGCDTQLCGVTAVWGLYDALSECTLQSARWLTADGVSRALSLRIPWYSCDRACSSARYRSAGLPMSFVVAPITGSVRCGCLRLWFRRWVRHTHLQATHCLRYATLVFGKAGHAVLEHG